MRETNRKQRLLQEAVKLIGKEALAARLNTTADTLDVWLRGLATMPDYKLGPLADVLDERPNKGS
jgi:hypothetical protein